MHSAYKIHWPGDQPAFMQMSRRQLADVLVEIGVQDLKERAVAATFGLSPKKVTKEQLEREAIDLRRSWRSGQPSGFFGY